MSIKIEQVNVKSLGPLNDFPCTFKQVNLIYGHNEQGKTYLVEFIYRSLFKNLSLNLRDTTGSGQVIVSGLEDKETLFSPANKNIKLEDFWEEDLPGLPRDFSKLLVVKGADLDFSSSSTAGIDDKILKEFLSGEGLLEMIGSKISATERKATYENGKISGPKLGLVKEYYEAQTRIKQIDDAMLDVNENISGGKRFELKQKIEDIKDQKEEQEQARCHLAFTIAGQMSDLKEQLDSLPEDLINSADKLIMTHKQKKEELEKKQLEMEENREKSKNYLWLESAVAGYQKLLLTGTVSKLRSGVIWLVLTVIAAALAVLLVFLRQPYFGVGMILLAVLFGYLHLGALKHRLTNATQLSEIEKITKDYQERFGGSANVQEATLVSKLKELQPAYYAIDQLTKDIQTLIGDLSDLEKGIDDDLKKLPSIKNKKGDWQSTINSLQEKMSNLDAELRKKENEWSKLDIDESDYLPDPATVQYDATTLINLTNDLQAYEDQIGEIEEEVRGLKQVICTLTRHDINTSWEDLVEVLVNKRDEEVNRYKGITADLIARITVNEVLNELREIEQERIEDGLSSSAICQALFATTGHYDRVEKEDGELYVADSYGRYRVADLSTGAREQVLLGLRIGFAAMLLAGTPLFLILDDAFQHSDWRRRERLVKKLFDLSKEGWQIIYFTMDDHIRQLFEENAKKAGKVQYQTIELPEMN